MEKTVFTLKTDNGLVDYDLSRIGTFGMLRKMEQRGVDVMSLTNGQATNMGMINLLIVIFSILVNKSEDEATELMDEHVRNGGNIEDIMIAFQNVMERAGFGNSQK